MTEPLLRIRDLHTHYFTDEGVVHAVDGVSLDVRRGETLGIVGESGCGKSVTALSVLRLVAPPGQIVRGEILFDGRDLLALPAREMRGLRGSRISMIFQEPMTSLNPVLTIGTQIAETILAHEKVAPYVARKRAIEMLHQVRIPSPEQRIDDYPHQLSGGMRQRVMIAIALACRPELLIADEPTTALDVTIQARILRLLRDLQRDFDMAVMLITHNMGLIATNAQHVAVMYASRVVETGPTRALFDRPLHPYTQGLLEAVPTLGMSRDRPLSVVPGAVPNPLDPPTGCRFHPRCPFVEDRCRQEVPTLREHRAEQFAACHLIENGEPPTRGLPPGARSVSR